MVIYAYFKAILGPFTVISYTSNGGMKYSVMPRLTQDYIQLLGVATGSSRSSHNVNFCVTVMEKKDTTTTKELWIKNSIFNRMWLLL